MNIGIGCLAVLVALVVGLGALFFASSSTASVTVEATAAPSIGSSPTL